VLVQRQEAEREMTERLQKMQVDKQIAVEMAASLQRSVQTASNDDKRRAATRLQNDKTAPKNARDKVIPVSG